MYAENKLPLPGTLNSLQALSPASKVKIGT
jgi:hypothetical protein